MNNYIFLILIMEEIPNKLPDKRCALVCSVLLLRDPYSDVDEGLYGPTFTAMPLNFWHCPPR